MKKICVVTGGGSGMGLETAKIVGKEQMIILVGRTVSKLENALNELKGLGIEACSYPCDASDIESVKKLAEYAKSQGEIKTVVHAAGVSPHMTSFESIFKINALGTINIDEVFGPLMSKDSCILNVASMAGHMLPESNQPVELYKMALTDPDAFIKAAVDMISKMPNDSQNGSAYTISKNFVIWYSKHEACKYGKQGVRVVSISPGTFSTPMGDVEGKEAADFAIMGALGRVGDPVEIARMMAFMVSDQASYLTGVDILYDGGTIASMNVLKENKA